MYNNKRTAVIIAAAGRGKRLGGNIPKQFLKLGGEYVITKTLKAFEHLDAIDHIFIVTNDDYMDFCKKIVDEYNFGKVDAIVAGGRKDRIRSSMRYRKSTA